MGVSRAAVAAATVCLVGFGAAGAVTGPPALAASGFVYRTDLPGNSDWSPWPDSPLSLWDADVQPAISCIRQETGFGTTTYAGHDPSEGRAVDIRPDSVPDHTKLANWLLGMAEGSNPLGILYIVASAQIYDTQTASSGVRQMSDRGSPTQNHQDHVHVSFKPTVSVSCSSVPSFGGGSSGGATPVASAASKVSPTASPSPSASKAPVKASPSSSASVSPAQTSAPVKPPYTQQQMEAAVAKDDPQQAHALGAIAMAETQGSQFPTTNNTGTYHGPWAFQEGSHPGVDYHRLDVDLDYSAHEAAKLAASGITSQKWSTWPDAAAKYMGNPSPSSPSAAASPKPSVAPSASSSPEPSASPSPSAPSPSPSDSPTDSSSSTPSPDQQSSSDQQPQPSSSSDGGPPQDLTGGGQGWSQPLDLGSLLMGGGQGPLSGAGDSSGSGGWMPGWSLG